MSALTSAGVKTPSKKKQEDRDKNHPVDDYMPPEISLIGAIWKVKREFNKSYALTKKRLRYSDKLVLVECDDCLLLFTTDNERDIEKGVNKLFEAYGSIIKEWETFIPESHNIYFLYSFYLCCIERGLPGLVPSYNNNQMKKRYIEAMKEAFTISKISIDSKSDDVNELDYLSKKHNLNKFYRALKKNWNFGL